jgi:uncharacterized Zn-finger protein
MMSVGFSNEKRPIVFCPHCGAATSTAIPKQTWWQWVPRIQCSYCAKKFKL